MNFKTLSLLLLISSIVMISCSDPVDLNIVKLNVGDDFQAANNTHESGTTFIVKSGIHEEQQVLDPKFGNIWIGEPGAVMDGKDTTLNAFSGTANFVTIEGIEIRNYVDNGIFFKRGHNINLSGLFIRDTGSGSGNQNGAIRLYQVRDVRITDSRMYQVTAGALLTRCRGPILIHNNGGVNIGRNFVQLDKCIGSDIEISQNRMERRGSFLRKDAEDVVDWISIYRSSGTHSDPIKVINNRALGHGHDPTGSFIMLGDEGGKHQLAKTNIGINPGQVGIGLSGGDNITVKRNYLITAPWEHSNVAIYSANYTRSEGCGSHLIKENRSYWYSNSSVQNNIWKDDSCGTEILNNIYPDISLSDLVWTPLDF